MKLRLILLTTMLIVCAFCLSCGRNVRESFTLFSMDTLLEAAVFNSNDIKKAESICSAEASRLEGLLSATINESDVSRFNSSESGVFVSDETAVCVRIANAVKELSAGAFDVSVAPLVRLWNISHAPDGWTPPSDADISDRMKLLGDVFIEGTDSSSKEPEEAFFLSKSEPETEIDLGGVGKGFACGKLAALLSEQGSGGVLSFGGNVAVFGKKPDGSGFSIGVKNPSAPDELIGKLTLTSGIVAVSGGYERFALYGGKAYHHIIDPSTGYPSGSDLASAVIVTDISTPEAGAAADALSTACFVIGSEKTHELFASDDFKSFAESLGCNFGYLLIKSDLSISVSDNLSDAFARFN